MDYTDDAERPWGTTDGAFWWELEPWKEGLPGKSCSFWSSTGDREKWNMLLSCSLLPALHLPMVSPISWSQRPKGPGSVVPWDGEQSRAGKSTDWQEMGTFNKVYKTEIVWSNLSPHPTDVFHNTNTHTYSLAFSVHVCTCVCICVSYIFVECMSKSGEKCKVDHFKIICRMTANTPVFSWHLTFT